METVEIAQPPPQLCEAAAQVGDGGLYWMAPSDFSVSYRPRAPDPMLKLVTASSGQATVVQGGQRVALGAGGFAVVDARYRFQLSCRGARMMHLCLPLPLLATQHPYLDVNALRQQGSATPAGRMLGRALGCLAEEGPQLDEDAQQSAYRSLLELLGAGPRLAPERPELLRVQRAQALIAAQLGSGELSVTALAERLGVSRRHLDSAFTTTTGGSVASYIREQRLQRAAADLRAGSDLSTTQVAYRWGFADASHFARRFRARFGERPSEYAQQARTGG